jgi:menaquinone-9 beta-reductase
VTPDVLIVGAGPAGAALAALLAGRGLRVDLIDAARFPRAKPCGESLNPGAVAALHRLGLWEAAAPLAPGAVCGWRFHVGRRTYDLDYPPGHAGATVDRCRLDHALAAGAAARGARLTEGVRATDLLLEPTTGRVTGVCAGHTRLPARLVVGADGLRSVVLRRLGLVASGTAPPRVAFTAHWTGVEGLGARGEIHVQGQAICGIAPVGRPGYAGPPGPGAAWAPHSTPAGAPAEANIVLVLPATAARGFDPVAALQARWPDPALRHRLRHAHPLDKPLATGPFDQPVRAVHAPGALLIGDAAGYFDPLTGQGIYRALRSAELAAAAIITALETGAEPAAFAAYQDRLRSEFDPAVRRQRWLDALIRRPGALSASLALLTRCPPAARQVMRLAGDCTRPEGATRP